MKPPEKDKYAFILVTDETHWNQLCEHSKNQRATVFVRKSKVAPKYGQKLLFYVKKPDAQIRGTADLIERVTGDSQTLWAQLGKESCFNTIDEYKTFLEGRDTATFVEFKNLKILKDPISSFIFSAQVGFPLTLRGGKYLSQAEFARLEI